MLVKWFIFLSLALTTKGSRKPSILDDPHVNERVMKKILESCFVNDDSSRLIVIFGDFNEFVHESSIIRMNNSLDVDEAYEARQLSNVGASKVVLMENSSEQLQSDLLAFKKTRWWNHMIPFFIIGNNDEKCGNSREILNITWNMSVINSIYICSESKNTTALYTLNPITNYAPAPWKRIEEEKDLNVYHQIFDPNHSCENLNYDKTKFLNGYAIKAIRSFTKSSRYRSFEDYVRAFAHYPHNKFLHCVIQALNCTLIHEAAEDINSAILHIENSSSDLVDSVQPLASYPNNSLLFPHHQDEIIAVIKATPEVSTLRKILNLWSTPVLIAAFVSLVIFFSILAMKNPDIMSTLLDLIRFLTAVSIRTNIAGNSFKIYFAAMLIFIVTSNGVFQGKIAAFLTTRERVQPFGTFNELIERGYKFYGNRLECELLRHKYGIEATRVSSYKCIDYVLNGTRNACICSLKLYKQEFILKSLDYVKEPLDVSLRNVKSRRNWPLHDRINDIIVRVFESDLYNFWVNKVTRRSEDKRKARDIESASSEYRPVRLVKLDFAFKLLAIGLSIATIAFVMELRMAND